MTHCKICGEYNCKKHTFLIGKSVKIDHFSGSSPPEIFIGKHNYPNVNIGVLSPQIYGNTELLSSPEQWHKSRLQISHIISLRNQLIYGKKQSNVKRLSGRFLKTMQEVALTHKSVSTEFFLKKPVSKHRENDYHSPLINNTAPVEKMRLEENPKIIPKVEYIVSDTDAKSVTGILELDKSGLSSTQIIKILSAGLLGQKLKRRLVPTRWSITCVDSLISENKIKKIREYPLINEYQVFNEEYLGNHYEIILMPRFWSFEVLEIGLGNKKIWQDYETIFKRKKYAESVTGAYYANRVAVCEYLERIRRQASCLVLREIRPEYNTPLGVGILREAARAAINKSPKKFDTLKEALKESQSRLKQPIENFINKSELIKSLQQKTLDNF
jgi:DNA repair protein NreA